MSFQFGMSAFGRRFVGGDASVPWITSTNVGTNRNNYNGWLGCSFNVGASNLIVTDLGRWVVSGNSQAHDVVLWSNAGTGLASVSVSTSGLPTGFSFRPITPITLLANTKYRIGSREFAGGDYLTNIVIPGSLSVGAAIYQSAYGLVWPSTEEPSGALKTYQGPNFKFHF